MATTADYDNPEGVRDMNEAVGEFMLTYSGIEYMTTELLRTAYKLNTRDGYILLQGMSFPVKVRKLDTALKHRKNLAGDLRTFLRHLDDVTAFRDRLVHWYKFFHPNLSAMDLADFGRNPQNIMQRHITISPKDIREVTAWLQAAHTGLFGMTLPLALGKKDQIDDRGSLLPLGAPPIPKGTRATDRKRTRNKPS